MKVAEIMSRNPACCQAETTLGDAARMMSKHDCGALPVLDGANRLSGIVTDRDIALRGIANGLGHDAKVQEVMTKGAETVAADAEVSEASDLMETHQLRRLPVVDEAGSCCGMLAQADIARHAGGEVRELLHDISQPLGAARH